ncbi:MAG: hypothetical protein MSJ26_06100 [Oscillospiraceae bacterium]|nr:hypothetical protein [Oscillospiraceae bacterium]
MKGFIRRTAALFMAMSALAVCPLSAEAAVLKTEDGIRYIQYDNGETKAYTGWTTKAGKRYYYIDGIMKKNCWITSKGKKKYFLTADGSAAVGKVTVSGVEYEFDDKGRLIPDEWGITFTAKEVTPTGLKAELLWDGTPTTGSLEFGEAYTLERYNDGKWEAMPILNHDIAFIALSYHLSANEPNVLNRYWDDLYGVLECGQYRLCTSVIDYRKGGDYDEKMYYAYFTIKGND